MPTIAHDIVAIRAVAPFFATSKRRVIDDFISRAGRFADGGRSSGEHGRVFLERSEQLVVGHDCTFGNRRRGTPELLREAGKARGFAVTVIEPVSGGGAVYSSTHIRELLKAGKPREAAAQLGRFWEIDGRVALGDQRGRTIGFPTANLGLGEYLRPAFGVYAVRVSGDGPDDPLGGATIDGVANLGLRPTVGTLVPRLEAHLFDINTDLYGRHLRVALVDFIRPERKFSGFDELKQQIAADAAKAREILAAEPRQ